MRTEGWSEWALLAGVLALASACGDDGATFSDACNPDEQVVLGGVTYAERDSGQTNAGFRVCDPDLFVSYYEEFGNFGEPLLNLVSRTDWNGSAYGTIRFNLNLYGPGTALYEAGSGNSGDFQATFSTTGSNICIPSAGSVSVTSLPTSSGDTLEGTFDFVTVDGADCEPLTGSFRGIRIDAATAF